MLVISSLTAAWVYFSWTTQPERIDAWGQHIKARYLAGPEGELAAAEKELEDGREQEALDRLRRLAKRLRTTHKGDSLFPVRQAALHRIAETSERLGHLREALRAYEALIHIDPRDLSIQMERNALLLRIPGQRRSGEVKIRELFARVPTSPDIATRFLRLSCGHRDLVNALSAAEAIRNTSLARANFDDWRFYWDTGDSFSRKQSRSSIPTWTKDGGVELSAMLRENDELLRFRIDTPAGIYIRLENPKAIFVSAGQIVRWSPPGKNLRLSGIEESEGGWITNPSTSRETSHFIFHLPSPLSAAQGLKVYFSTNIRPAIPADIQPLLADEDVVAGARRELLRTGDTVRLELLDSMLRDGLPR